MDRPQGSAVDGTPRDTVPFGATDAPSSYPRGRAVARSSRRSGGSMPIVSVQATRIAVATVRPSPPLSTRASHKGSPSSSLPSETPSPVPHRLLGRSHRPLAILPERRMRRSTAKPLGKRIKGRPLPRRELCHGGCTHANTPPTPATLEANTSPSIDVVTNRHFFPKSAGLGVATSCDRP